MIDTLPTRQRVLRRIAALDLERSTWLHHWKEINRVLLPRTGRFFELQQPTGRSARNEILDNTATKALGTLAAGMQTGLTSPARPWFKLETADADLMENKAVSSWLDLVTQKLLAILARSNVYRVLHSMYSELGAYGTSASFMLPDFQDVIRLHPMTVGEYCLSTNDRGDVDTLSRKFQMTVHQIVGRYVWRNGKMDWSTTTPAVKNLWDNHQQDTWVPVWQLVQPRTDRDPRMLDSKNMRFESLTIESGGDDTRVLNESGFRQFPVLAPRWMTSGQDIYGSDCPGMVSLGDIIQLQDEQLRKGKGIAYLTDPPVQIPISLKNSDADLLPGGSTYVDMTGPNNRIQSAFDVQINLQHLLMDLQDVRGRINSAFFADLFLFLSNIDTVNRGRMTAREVAEIHEEKLLMLGPVVENIGSELQAPIVELAFSAAMDSGILPPAPPELSQQGAELKVEFIGVLAQAQRSVSMSSVDRFIGAVASIAAAKQDPSVWDKVDTDAVTDKAAGYLGIDPELVRTEDDVNAIRQQRAQAQQAAAQAASAQAASETTKNLAASPVSTDNALGQLVQGFAGAPQ